MIRSKKTDVICIICAVISVITAVALMVFSGKEDTITVMNPAEKLRNEVISDEYSDGYIFDDSYVHEINLIISDVNWDYMVKNAIDEVYVSCDAEIDGEYFSNIAIRPKGNSSLSAISNNGGTNFSFKIEFDQYNAEQTYHGLDKLSLNNLGQDPSCMKDFLAYHMMNSMEVPAPLSSYTLVKLNGEDFGLYLTVEAVEDSFCYRNYGENYGNMYKPDSFSMSSLDLSALTDPDNPDSPLPKIEKIMTGEYFANTAPGERTDILGEIVVPTFASIKDSIDISALNYVGDNTKDYSLIFDTSVFDITETDKKRLIQSVKELNTSDNIENSVDTEKMLRYWTAHNFVNNYDGYTGVFVHNFYIHEKNGKISLVPWDYNFAFGSFTLEGALSSILGEDSRFDYTIDTGNAMNINTSMINYPVDTPNYSVNISDRPLLDKLLSDEKYLQQYHEYFNEFISGFFDSGYYDNLYMTTYENIRPYIEKGLTVYTPAQFEKGSETINDYCHLRAESVRRQLNGTLPSTTEGQKQNYSAIVDTGNLNLAYLSDFHSLVAGLDTEAITEIIDILLEDKFSYDTNGVVEAVHYYISDTGKLINHLPELLEVSLIHDTVMKKVFPVILMIISVIAMIVSYRLVKKYSRRRD